MANIAWLAVHVAIAVPFVIAASPSRSPGRPPLAGLPAGPQQESTPGTAAPSTAPLRPALPPTLQPAHD